MADTKALVHRLSASTGDEVAWRVHAQACSAGRATGTKSLLRCLHMKGVQFPFPPLLVGEARRRTAARPLIL